MKDKGKVNVKAEIKASLIQKQLQEELKQKELELQKLEESKQGSKPKKQNN